MRGLCNGLGPAMFGLIFYMFNVDLNEEGSNATSSPPVFETYLQVQLIIIRYFPRILDPFKAYISIWNYFLSNNCSSL